MDQANFKCIGGHLANGGDLTSSEGAVMVEIERALAAILIGSGLPKLELLYACSDCAISILLSHTTFGPKKPPAPDPSLN